MAALETGRASISLAVRSTYSLPKTQLAVMPNPITPSINTTCVRSSKYDGQSAELMADALAPIKADMPGISGCFAIYVNKPNMMSINTKNSTVARSILDFRALRLSV